MICPKCARYTPDSEEYCGSCGFYVEWRPLLDGLRKETSAARENASKHAQEMGQLIKKIDSLEAGMVKICSDKGLFRKKNEPPCRPVQSEPVTEKAEIPHQEIQKAPVTEVQLGQKWLLVAGIIIMVIGIGYFLKYAMDKNWVSPEMRIISAYFTAAAILYLGEYFRKKLSETFGLYLTGGGIAVLYMSTYAAFQIYRLIGQVPAFGIMILITVLAGVLSVFYNARWLSVLGIIGGFMTPVLLSTGRDSQAALMTYMIVLNSGIVFIASYKQWKLLNSLGFFFTWLLFSAWFGKHYKMDKFWITTFFLNVFFLMYAVIPFVYYFSSKVLDKFRGLKITVLNAFIAFCYSFAMIKAKFGTPYVSIVSIAYAFVFLMMAQILFVKNARNREPVILLISKAVMFLIITVPVLFSGHLITVFWLAQALALFWISLKLDRPGIYSTGFFLFHAAVFKMLFYDYPEIYRLCTTPLYFVPSFYTFLNERLAVYAMLFSSFILINRMMTAIPHNTAVFGDNRTSGYFKVSGVILLFIVLNIETSSYFHTNLPGARFAALSVLWALFSFCMIFLGFRRNIPSLRKWGITLFACTVFKVFLFDMSHISTPFRILSFTVLGVMMIIASFLYHKFKDKIKN